MPNRYEREIEEILRNLEGTDPKPGAGQKIGERLRRKPGPRMRTRQSRFTPMSFSTSERLLMLAVVAALIAGGYEFITQRPDIFSLVLALVAVICLVLVACSQFLFQERRPQSYRYGNVTITPLRGGLLNSMKTQWNLLKLKMRYRRKNGH